MALPTASELYSKAENYITGYGNAQQAALKQSYQNALGMGMQSLASSGLAGTTIAPSMRMGYMRQYQQSLNELNDKLTSAHLNVESTFGLGGLASEQSAQQISNQMKLGEGNLAVSQKYADIASQQLALQQQEQAYNQNYQQQSISQSSSNLANSTWNKFYSLASTGAANFMQGYY